MNSFWVLLWWVVIVVLGYWVYARHVAKNIFGVDPNRATPAKMYMDGVDFMPAQKNVLYGFQLNSIAGAAPIIGPIVALHLGSGDNFPGRRWPVKNFARLAHMLEDKSRARCILTGTDPEKTPGQQCEEEGPSRLLNAIGKLDIKAFIELLARVDLLVTNDTAPAHIGSALETPLIAFYGPNTPELYGPLHAKSRIFYNRLPCSPCLTT